MLWGAGHHSPGSSVVMRPTLPLLSVLLLVGCGPAADPTFEPGKGELASYLTEVLSQATGNRTPTNPLPLIQGAWSCRVLTPANVSAHYLLPQGWHALQVLSDASNFGPLNDWLTASLGKPVSLGDSARGIAWQPAPITFSIWLSKSNDVCMLQVSAPARRRPL